MRTVIAALDTTPAAGPVLAAAERAARLTGSHVVAVHVTEDPAHPSTASEGLGALTGRLGLRLLEGQVVPALSSAIDAEEVVAGVIGARSTPGGRRPVGTTARRVLERTAKPVVVVPPDAPAPGPFHRLLIPLEGTRMTSRAVLEGIVPLLVDDDVELVVLHVFTEATAPPMLDRPVRDFEILGKEFLIEHCPAAAAIELRGGPVATRVVEVAADRAVDLIVLSWSQSRSAQHALVVREVLGSSPIPVLLLPASVTHLGGSRWQDGTRT